MFTLVAGGDRLVAVSLTEAGEILQRFQDEAVAHSGDHECKLMLDGRAWRPEVLEVLTPLFVDIRSKLVVLKLDDIIPKLDTEVGLSTFRYLGGTFAGLPNLREIILDENAVGKRGLDLLEGIFNNAPSLERISLRKLGLASEDAETLDRLISRRVRKNLTHLSMSENKFGSQGANIIGPFLGDCDSLQVLRYRYNRPSDCDGNGTLALCQGIARLSNCARNRDSSRSRHGNRTTSRNGYRTRSKANSERTGGLRILEIDSLNVQDVAACTCLFETLRDSPNLQQLCLADCNLVPSQLSLLVYGLRESGAKNLISLDLEGNELDGASAQTVADFLEQTSVLQRLEKLVLSSNKIADDGIVRLVRALAKAPNLKTLLLAQTNMTGIGAQALLDNHIPNLQTFDIEDNIIPQNLVDQLRAAYTNIIVDDYYDGGDDDDDDEDYDGVFFQQDNDGDSLDDDGSVAGEDEVDALADALAESQIY